MTCLRLASCIATIVIAASATAAHAKRIVVDSRLDLPDGNCSAGAPTGKCTLRAAVREANRSTGRDTIVLDTNVYSLTLSGPDDAASVGDLDITEEVSIEGVGPGSVIDASTLAMRDRVFHVLAGPVRFEMLQIRGGDNQAYGAGILVDNAQVTLQNVWLHDNHASSDGGGLRATGANAIVTVNDSRIERNTAARGAGIALDSGASLTMTFGTVARNNGTSGGGLYLHGLASADISDSTFDGNTAIDGAGIANIGSTLGIADSVIENGVASGNGGGIENIDATLGVSTTTIATNQALTGGGIYWDTSTTSFMLLGSVKITDNTASSTTGGGGVYAHHGTVLIDGAMIDHNDATAGPGGGLVLDPGTGIASLFHANVSTNTAATDGGGIAYPTSGSVLSIERSTIDTNTATRDGGGIWAPSLGTSKLLKSTVSGNVANRNGGGLWLGATSATTVVSVLNTTIAYNAATTGTGAGVYAGSTGTFDVGHTILSENGNECGGPGRITSRGYNLLRSRTGCTYTSKGTDLIGLSASLGPLLNNGGATRTHKPMAGPAIEGGSPTASDCGDSGPYDQRDAPHGMPLRSRCDIGSFETP